MRKVMPNQLSIGETDISQIEFDLRCRDEIPKILKGLQYIYCTTEIRKPVFKALQKLVPKDISAEKGRSGLDLWKIFVLGTLRLCCSWDFDKLHDCANNHRTLRQMLLHGLIDDGKRYPLQTIKDNVALFTPEILDEINQIVVRAGHQVVGKKLTENIQGKCDSFVVQTNVHYPTDINLLLDAMRKVIRLTAQLCDVAGLSDWRQSEYNYRKIKQLYRKAQRLKHSTSKDKEKQAKRERLIAEAHQTYIDASLSSIEKAESTLEKFDSEDLKQAPKIQEVERYIKHARRQIDQIQRRVIQDETIPHEEKVLSLFQEHTEWISKGKAGVPQELGLRVCVVNDNYGFILHHQVMEKLTDDKVTVSIVEATQARFPELNGCSFDKGFYTPDNKKKLTKLLEKVVLPKKGKLSAADKEHEHSEYFIRTRQKHSAIESAINALEHSGLSRCPDHGIDGFKRYVALAVVARNLQTLGHLLQEKQRKRQVRLEKYRATWQQNQANPAVAAQR